MKKYGRKQQQSWGGFAAALLLLACNNPGAATSSSDPGPSTASAGGSGSGSRTAAATPSFAFATFTPTGGSGGSGGSAPMNPAQNGGPPFGVSTTCGDAILGANEECDDGPGTALDACTPQCQTRDQPATTGPKTDRLQGAGRHPIAGLDSGFVDTYVEFPTNEAAVGATLFNVWGQPQHRVSVSDGASPIDGANPVAAALPGGRYAVAWTDFDGDGSDLGVALRKINADGTLGRLGVANGSREFSQQNPDMLWTGSQLVVAWEDYADAANGPDLRYRLFDADLNPISDDSVLAASALPEAAVALAPFNGSWAAAYREGTVDGKENVVVKVGSGTFRTDRVQGGSPDDRPALVALDATHLLLVFSAGMDPGATGVNNVPRLRYSVVDTAGSGTLTSQSLDPLDDILSLDAQVSQLSPAAVAGIVGTNSAYLAWRSEARSGDAAGDQLWLKYVTWNPASTPALEAREAEMLIPRTCEANIGDQRTPELAFVPATALPPSGALAMAWDDYSHSQGMSAGDPDVVVHYAPTHERDPAQGSVFAETWKAPNGSPWPSQWSTEVTNTAATKTIDVQNYEGRFVSSTANTAVSYVNNHTALNVDMVTKIRFGAISDNGGLVARRADSDSDSYFGVRFGAPKGELLRLFAMIDGVRTDIQTLALPPYLSVYGAGLDFMVRLRVVTNTGGSVTLSAKYWPIDFAEPASWTITGTFAATSPAAVRMGNRPGRFGVYAVPIAANVTTIFDDFRAVFFEGTILGDLDSNVAPPAPLGRARPLYRTCTPGSKCTTAQACCFDGSECQTGLTCSGALSEFFGFGSDAKTCAPDHCTNKIMDAGETRADCGGPDCAPCTCTSTAQLGATGYCTPACPCGAGGTDCTTTADCLPGLVCAQEWGYKYGFPNGTDSCVPQHCFDRVTDADELGPDWGNSCGNVQCGSSTNGGYQHCTVSCPCAKGHGDCDYADECLPGLVCGSGVPWGLGFNVCVALHCTNTIKDADETAKNCGGADCAPCP